MGVEIKDGKVTFVSEDGTEKSSLLTEAAKKAADFAVENSGMAFKAATVGVGAGAVLTVGGAGGTAALGALAGGTVATVAATQIAKNAGSEFESSPLEPTTGGVNYEEILQREREKSINSPSVNNALEPDIPSDPFEAFRKTMGNLNVEVSDQQSTGAPSSGFSAAQQHKGVGFER